MEPTNYSGVGLQPQYVGPGASLGQQVNNATAQPVEPNLAKKLEEAQGYLMQLHDILGSIEESLQGPQPNKNGTAGSTVDRVLSINERAAIISKLAANAVGWAGTIKAKLS